MAKGTRVGEVTHYYQNIAVAVVELEGELAVGDSVHFLGANTDFRQQVKSMQIEREPLESAETGEIAIKVKQRVRGGDAVFLLEGED